MFLLKMLVGLYLLLAGFLSQASEVWGEKGYHHFVDSLPKASPEALDQITNNYDSVLTERLKIQGDKVRLASFKDIDPVLRRAVEGKMGVLDLFSLKDLADPSAHALLLDAETLKSIEGKYNLSSIFMINPKSVLPHRPSMTMQYMLVGQGRLIVGYPFSSPVEIVDDGKTMEYRYEPLITAKIVHSGAKRGLFQVETLNSPSDGFQPFQGPMGASIKSYAIHGDKILVTYSLVIEQETQAPRKSIVMWQKTMARNESPGSSALGAND
jgi:hypothetical protein